ncbi:MAG: hypothetical protein IE931_14295 [Sphingobacteriales bacterium]|nr:hypothetical protein [Sphingobacteriales bacterium]
MKDKLQYAMPFVFLGRIANSIMVAKQTQEIFNFREKAVEVMFGVYK